MIGLDGITTVLADLFFSGDTGIAAMAIYVVVMMIVFALFAKENLMIAFVLMLPITVIFNAMSTLPDSITILLVVVAIIGLVSTVKDKVV